MRHHRKDAGLLVREPDSFRENRSEYRITELAEAAANSRGRIQLIDLDRLYAGS